MTCENCAELILALEVAQERIFWDNSAEGRKALRIINAAIANAKGES